MLWLQRWNFIERARLERELWDAFERGEDLEALLQSSRDAASGGGPEAELRREVWQTTATRIRRIERLMQGQPRPDGAAGASTPPPAEGAEGG